MAATVYPGDYCDVANCGGQVLFARQSAPPSAVLTVAIGVVEQHGRQMTERGLWVRAAANPLGRWRVIMQGNDSGLALVYTDLSERVTAKSLGPTFGQQCVCVTWEANENAFVYYIQRSASTWTRWVEGRPDPGAQPISRGPTSQGFLQILDRQPQWTDDHRVVTVNGLTIAMPCYVDNDQDPVVVGQSTVTNAVDGLDTAFDPFRAITASGCFEPHVALCGTVYAVCCRTPDGAALTICPPFPPIPAEPPVTPPIVPPVVPPVIPPVVPPITPPVVPAVLGDFFMLLTTVNALVHLGLNKQASGLYTLTANKAGEVVSIQVDGSFQTRPKGTAGPFELFQVDGAVATVKPTDKPFVFLLAPADKL